MAIYRTVSLSFWTDSKIDDDFTPEDKYFMLYLLTNPHTKLSGCYEIGSKQFERETGYNTDTISRLIDRMENVHNVIRYCKPTKEVLILNWNKYNWCGNSPKVLQAVKKEAESIKHEPFKDFIFKKIENPDYQYAEPVSEPVSEPVTETVTDVCIGYGYPIDTEKKTSRSAKKVVNEDFEYLWNLYPKKQGKQTALKAYESAVKRGTTKEEVETGIRNYIAWLNANHTDAQYIKNGDTFFRGAHWQNDYTITGVNTNNGIFNKYGGISGTASDSVNENFI